MQYRFVIKEFATKTSKVLFRSAWFEVPSLEAAIKIKDDYLIAHPEYTPPNRVTWETRKGGGRGGARPGAGTKSPGKNGAYKGMGAKYDEPTKVVRVPASKSQQIDSILESIDTIQGVLDAWQAQAVAAASESVTGKVPRTYDKALQLVAELKEELQFTPF